MSTYEYGGIYRAICTNNNDPQTLNRIQMQIPALFGNDTTDWAWSVGVGDIPSVGDGVWVMFEAGNPSFPLWLGSFDGSTPSVPTTVNLTVTTTVSMPDPLVAEKVNVQLTHGSTAVFTAPLNVTDGMKQFLVIAQSATGNDHANLTTYDWGTPGVPTLSTTPHDRDNIVTWTDNGKWNAAAGAFGF